MPIVPTAIYAFIGGTVTALALVAALLFARFYRRTGDRLFVFFAVAFGILALNNVIFIFAVDRFTEAPEDARHPLLYGIRLVAFGLIIFAIIDKNRLPRKTK